jgi:hypothetical protein
MLTWILLGLAFWTVGFGFLLVLMRMSGDEDRAARHDEHRMHPFSDVPITQFGNGA